MAATIDIIVTVKLQAAPKPDKIQRCDPQVEEQEGEAKGDQRRRSHVAACTKGKVKGKMNSKWEGPFLVTEMSRPEAYRLQTLEGVNDPYLWNKEMLQKYFVKGKCKGRRRVDNRRCP
jgi:hypothetical protein